MVKQELIQRSPVRVFEKSIHGGLKAGDVGVIASRKGVGKTSVLVQIALDKLLQGKKVIHVSFAQHTDYVIAGYEDIFSEIAKKKNLENAVEVKSELVKNRVLMNFNQDSIDVNQMIKSLRALIADGGFNAESVIIDGFDFARAAVDHMTKMRAFAKEMNLEVWFSCTMAGQEPLLDKHNVPVILRNYLDNISVLINLDPQVEYIHFIVVKDHDRMNPADLHIKLDAKTLLIAEV